MVAAVGFDLSPLIHAVSSGAGKVAAALAVAGLAYLMFAAALWLMRSGSDREGSDASGFVLIAGLAAYVVVGLLLDAVWFGLLSAALIGFAVAAVFAGEVKSLASRVHHHAHGH